MKQNSLYFHDTSCNEITCKQAKKKKHIKSEDNLLSHVKIRLSTVARSTLAGRLILTLARAANLWKTLWRKTLCHLGQMHVWPSQGYNHTPDNSSNIQFKTENMTGQSVPERVYVDYFHAPSQWVLQKNQKKQQQTDKQKLTWNSNSQVAIWRIYIFLVQIQISINLYRPSWFIDSRANVGIFVSTWQQNNYSAN